MDASDNPTLGFRKIISRYYLISFLHQEGGGLWIVITVTIGMSGRRLDDIRERHARTAGDEQNRLRC